MVLRGSKWLSPLFTTVGLGERYLILLSVSGAADLLGADPNEFKIDGAPRVVLAAGVKDVDAAYEELKAKGVTFLRPPTDQPWGLRTAHFADPEGNLWEINQSIESKTEGWAKPFCGHAILFSRGNREYTQISVYSRDAPCVHPGCPSFTVLSSTLLKLYRSRQTHRR
jgi:hypothetical protein